MSFDPEQVPMFALYESEHSQIAYKTVVLSSDYEKLLARYRVLRASEPIWRHLVKRMYDECGTTKADEFIRRVDAGEHDVLSPWSSNFMTEEQYSKLLAQQEDGHVR